MTFVRSGFIKIDKPLIRFHLKAPQISVSVSPLHFQSDSVLLKSSEMNSVPHTVQTRLQKEKDEAPLSEWVYSQSEL